MDQANSRRAANAILNAAEYEQRRVILDSLPTMVYVELTQNCNLHCKMCRSGSGYNKAKDMSPEVFEAVVRDLMPFASMIDLRGWGESTILPAFPELARKAAATGVRLRLVTNGLAMTRELWTLLLETDGVIAISVDAATASLASELGRGDLLKVLAGCRQGVEIQRGLRRGEIYFNTVVSSLNLHELPGIVRVASAAGISKVVLNPIKTHPGDPASLANAKDALPRTMEVVRAIAGIEEVTIQLGAALDVRDVSIEGLPSTCANPWSHAVVSYNGDVIFCDHLIGQATYALGSLAKDAFSAIWNSPAYAYLRLAHIEAEKSREAKCFHKCTWCYANRYGESEGAPIKNESRRRVYLVPDSAVVSDSPS